MAPWDRDSTQQSSATTPSTSKRPDNPWDEENPFIAFRKFADEQFSALVSGFNAIPDLLNDVRLKAESQRSAWEQQSQEHSHRGSDTMTQQNGGPWHSVFFEHGAPKRASPEAREAARAVLLQSRNANLGVNPLRFLRLYSDASPGWGFDFDEPWLSVAWFRSSPYSPTNVEQDMHLHQYGSKWRAAFEDLMSAELDKEQRAHAAWTNKTNDQKLYSSWAQAPVDWMLGMQCRGILPPQLPSLYQTRDVQAIDSIFSTVINEGNIRSTKNPFHAFAVADDFERLAHAIGTFDEDERAEQMRDQARGRNDQPKAQNELDLYEAFLGNAGKDAKVEGDKVAKASSSAVQRAEQKPNIAASKILSTLSTTETTTSPDGTVTTKVVMKKRFADGREESTESVSTTHANEKARKIVNPQVEASAEEREGKQKEKKGWFWS